MIPTAWIRLSPGMRFSRLTVMEKTDRKDKWGKCFLWRCRCDCGNEVFVTSTMLRDKTVRSCGCLQAQSREVDLTDRRFGRLIAIAPTGEVRDHSRVWRCQCDCGNACDVRGQSLTDKSVRSCGCLRRATKAAQAIAMQHGCGRVDGTNLSIIGSHAVYVNNTSGVRGVTWHRGVRKFAARITFQHQSFHLGYFDILADAAAARKTAEEKLFAPMLEQHPDRKKERK